MSTNARTICCKDVNVILMERDWCRNTSTHLFCISSPCRWWRVAIIVVFVVVAVVIAVVAVDEKNYWGRGGGAAHQCYYKICMIFMRWINSRGGEAAAPIFIHVEREAQNKYHTASHVSARLFREWWNNLQFYHETLRETMPFWIN